MPALRTLGDALRLLRAEADGAVTYKFAAALALVIIGGMLAALAPLGLKALIDAVAERQATGASAGAVAVYGVGYVLALCGGRLLTEIRPLLHEQAEQRLYGRLSRRFFRHLLDLPLDFHLDRRTGALGQTLSQAVFGFQLLVHHITNSIVPVVVEVVAVAAILFALKQPLLVATFIAAAVAYLVIFVRSVRPLTNAAHELSTAAIHKHAVLMDSLLNYETIKYFNAEQSARERYADATTKLETQWGRLNMLRTKVGLAAAVTFTVSAILAVVAAAGAVADGSLSIGGFVLANVYMLQIVRPLETLGMALRDVTQSIGFVRPLLAVLDEPAEESGDGLHKECPFPQTAAPRSTRAASLRFERVTFRYTEDRAVLSDLNLEVGTGRTVAVVGASGAGKSSLVRLILRLYEPQHGRILLDGTPISELPPSLLRSVVGVVPQDTALFNDSIAYNIAIGKPDASRMEIEYAARLAHLHDFISSLPAGYDTVVGERGVKLSGGERQRVAIARAVIKRPMLYVFDEATSSLDSHTETEILRNLQDISAGCTTLVIAHRLTTVLRADEIAVLEMGQIVERGTHSSLLQRNGAYARLWHSQLRGRAA